MALYNATSLATTVFNNYTYQVFGSPIITAIILLLVIFLIALMVKIPLSISLSLLMPLTLIMMAIGWLPVIAGAIIVVILFVLAGFTMASNIF